MRDWSVRLFFVLLASSAVPLACATTPAISVVRTTPGDKAQEVRGDAIKLKRGQQDAYAGSRPGFYVVRSAADWEHAWPSGKAPAMPEMNTTNNMLLLAVAETQGVTQVRVQRAVETAEMIYVWVRETRLGEHCPNKMTERPFDAAIGARIDKPVKFFVEEERGESCGLPPVAGVECRIGGQAAWSPKMIAQPGDVVECALTATARGKFELIDKGLSMADLPAGSSAKLKFKKGADRGEFEVDVYGLYNVHAEAVDEGGRHGRAIATIDVKPPKSNDVIVQLVWGGFDIKDLSDNFPRVNLRVAEPGPKGQRCSAEIPVPGLCDVKTRGAYTNMRIPAGTRQLPISVQYLDERAEKGPGPCVHVWLDGARTAEMCDRNAREADEIWRVGVLDTTSGKITPDASPATPPAPPADAGAPKPPVTKKK